MKAFILISTILISSSIFADSKCDSIVQDQIEKQYNASLENFESLEIKELDLSSQIADGLEYEFKLVSFFHDLEVKVFIATLHIETCDISMISQIIQNDQ
jgi:hypothetical protein